jgi:hypothetical protein
MKPYRKYGEGTMFKPTTADKVLIREDDGWVKVVVIVGQSPEHDRLEFYVKSEDFRDYR